MSKAIELPIGLIQNIDDWIKHFVDMHSQMPGTPSPDEIRMYPQVFAQMLQDHNDLHVHFYTGHEHKLALSPLKSTVSLIVPGRKK